MEQQPGDWTGRTILPIPVRTPCPEETTGRSTLDGERHTPRPHKSAPVALPVLGQRHQSALLMLFSGDPRHAECSWSTPQRSLSLALLMRGSRPHSMVMHGVPVSQLLTPRKHPQDTCLSLFPGSSRLVPRSFPCFSGILPGHIQVSSRLFWNPSRFFRSPIRHTLGERSMDDPSGEPIHEQELCDLQPAQPQYLAAGYQHAQCWTRMLSSRSRACHRQLNSPFRLISCPLPHVPCSTSS